MSAVLFLCSSVFGGFFVVVFVDYGGGGERGWLCTEVGVFPVWELRIGFLLALCSFQNFFLLMRRLFNIFLLWNRILDLKIVKLAVGGICVYIVTTLLVSNPTAHCPFQIPHSFSPPCLPSLTLTHLCLAGFICSLLLPVDSQLWKPGDLSFSLIWNVFIVVTYDLGKVVYGEGHHRRFFAFVLVFSSHKSLWGMFLERNTLHLTGLLGWGICLYDMSVFKLILSSSLCS